MSIYKFQKSCRLCLNTNFRLVLDLGLQPPSNSFLSKNQLKMHERKFPLRLYLCKKCHHLQLLDVVDKKYLFSKYLYLTSANKPIIKHFNKYANLMYKKFLKKKNKPLVIEIGSNDGTFLKNFVKYDVEILGIEPAKNLATISRKSGIRTENKFFSLKLAKKISEKKKADLIIANNVLGHIDDLTNFIKSISILLADDGVFVFEVPHALQLIKNSEFDTIYHEHISYFLLIPLLKWLKKNNLQAFDVKKQKVHGGTIRVFVSKYKKYRVKKSILLIKKQEEKFGVNKIDIFLNFSKDIFQLKKLLQIKIKNFKAKDYIIFGYGAPAKGNVLLNFCGIDKKILDFIIDTTILKQGKFTPGTKIPIVSPKIIAKKGAHYIALLLAWNYKENILQNEEKFLRRGGKFLIPIPKPVVIKKWLQNVPK